MGVKNYILEAIVKKFCKSKFNNFSELTHEKVSYRFYTTSFDELFKGAYSGSIV